MSVLPSEAGKLTHPYAASLPDYISELRNQYMPHLNQLSFSVAYHISPVNDSQIIIAN